ncbi:MAG: glycosyltransferase family 4 protein [Gammaproteobacteria bacterium]
MLVLRTDTTQKHWRILLVLETSGGGSGRHVVDLARGLSDMGHEVHLVYSENRIEQRFAHDIKGIVGVQQARVDMNRASPHPCDFLAIKEIRAYLARFGPFEIVHGHSSKGGALARLAAIGQHAIRVYTPHAFRTVDPSLNRLLALTYIGLERLLYQLTDGIILVSQEEREHALACGLSTDKLFVVHNGIQPVNSPKRGEIRKRLGLNDNNVYLGFVGRFVPQKDPQRLISAFASLASRFPDLCLLMVGDGPLAPKLYQLVERLGQNGRIRWLDNEYGPDIMPAFDIFVMPSLYEGFPYVLVEAAAAGLPLVATRVGGTSAIIREGVNGLIVDNFEDLAQAIARLVEDPLLRRTMGEVSQQIAGVYTIENMMIQTCAVYEELLSRRAENSRAQSGLSIHSQHSQEP